MRQTQHKQTRGGGAGGGTHLLLACLSHLTIDHASLSRRSTVPTPRGDTSNIRALITFFFHIISVETFCLYYPLAVSPAVATIYLLG